MRKLSIFVLLIALAGCQQNEPGIQDDSRVLVQVGDQKITEKYLQAFLFNRGLKEPTKEQLDQGLDALIKQQALALQAQKLNLNLTLEQQLSIDLLKQQALAQIALNDYLQKKPVSDADIKSEYDQIVAEVKGIEYKVRHLLYKDEVQALMALDEINAGKSYFEVESAYLSDHAGIKNVGDLGWVNIKQVPEPFHQPLQTLNTNQVYHQVLVSQFGVHVLFLEDKRTKAPPAFEDVKEGIRKSLEQKVKDRFQQLAVIKAKVKIQQ